MNYIYDVLLNFDKNLYEFFEWNDNDNIKYVKKVIVFKVSSKTILDIIENEVVFDSNFTKKIPKYDMSGLKDAGLVCLLCDGKMAIGLFIKNNKPVFISRLLLDEEYEVLELCDKLGVTSISYEVMGPKKRRVNSLTRRENLVKDKLLDEISFLYENKLYDKLIYLYYEFTNKECDNVSYVYDFLIKSLNNFCDKHLAIYEVLLLSRNFK